MNGLNGQEAILHTLSTFKEGACLAFVHIRYKRGQREPMLLNSAYTCLNKLIDKGLAERTTEGGYRATGKPYYTNKGKNRPESRYITAIKKEGKGESVTIFEVLTHLAREADIFNKERNPDQAKRTTPTMLTALSYLSKLKKEKRVIQDNQGRFGLPKGE